MLWAWERPANLDFIKPQEVGVAFLAQTVYLRGGRTLVRPRLQPVGVPPGTTLTAVARLEPDRIEAPALSPQQRAEVVSAVLQLARLAGVSSLQIDFDATASEREFYRQLLIDLRRQLPPSFGLSITALASWCTYDDWISGLPVDEAVPMLFRMGRDNESVRHYLESGKDFRPALCRQSLGLSTDEWPGILRPKRRLYVFHPGTWSPELVKEIHAEVWRAR